MQKKFIISLSAITLTGVALFAGCSSSSGDDSTTTTPPDASTTQDVYVPPTGDSGATVDSGSDAALACQTCGGVLVNGVEDGPPCTTNGPPSSATLVTDLIACICGEPDGGAGQCNTASTCQGLCVDHTAPTADCISCFQSACTAPLNACTSDGVDGGAGDGGDAG